VPGVLGERHSDGGSDRQETGLEGDQEMRERDLPNLPLHHEDEAHRADLDGLVAAEDQSELKPLMQAIGHGSDRR
jgi:hypothetical protein